MAADLGETIKNPTFRARKSTCSPALGLCMLLGIYSRANMRHALLGLGILFPDRHRQKLRQGMRQRCRRHLIQSRLEWVLFLSGTHTRRVPPIPALRLAPSIHL